MTPANSNADVAWAALVAALGASLGDFASIFFGALGGSLWLLGKHRDTTRWEGALIVARMVLTSFALSGALAWWLEKEHGLPQVWMLTPISFFIAAMGDRWVRILDKIEEGITKAIGAIFSGGKRND